MNAPSKIDHEAIVNMTSKGQVLVPKEIRDLIGLKPGQPVRVGTNAQGQAVIVPTGKATPQTAEEKQARIRAALERARGTINLGGMTSDEYMKWLRGDWEP